MNGTTFKVTAAIALSMLGCVAHAGTVTYVYTDPQGTPLAEADTNGNITATFDYRPFGAQALGSPKNGPGYTGHLNDQDSGLVYMQARYYDPQINRFLSIDPDAIASGDPETFNRYSYADNNPVTNIDPTGRSTCADAKCLYSFIDKTLPSSNPQPPPVNGNEGILENSQVGRYVQAGYSATVSFVNDDKNGSSPNQPVTTQTANMVEGAITSSGVASVNINSTSGGHHAVASRHYQKKAVDINRINGQRVSSPQNSGAVQALQAAFSQQPNIRENFGPSFQEKTAVAGGAPVPWPNVGEDHQNHLHESGQN